MHASVSGGRLSVSKAAALEANTGTQRVGRVILDGVVDPIAFATQEPALVRLSSALFCYRCMHTYHPRILLYRPFWASARPRTPYTRR